MSDGTIFILSHETQLFFGQEDNMWNNKPMKLFFLRARTHLQTMFAKFGTTCLQTVFTPCLQNISSQQTLSHVHISQWSASSKHHFIQWICAAYIFLLNKRHPWRNWRRWQTRSMKECCMEKSFGRFETQRMSWLQKWCQNDTFQFWNVATNSWLQNIMNRYKVLSCKPCVHLINCYAYILTSPWRYLYFIVVVGIL